jgi:cob(I)alamin adenosyltransferase
MNMTIYSRTGDDGQTALSDGRRVTKDDARMEFTGTLDELNSRLGVARAAKPSTTLDAILNRLQTELFLLGAEAAGAPPGRQPAPRSLSQEHVRQLEADIDRLDADLPKLRAFILPGGSPAAAALHLARAVCRRTERRLVTLLRQEPRAVGPVGLAYLNRLSDLLFVLARTADAQSAADKRQ